MWLISTEVVWIVFIVAHLNGSCVAIVKRGSPQLGIQDGAGEWRREVAVCDSLCDSVGSAV